MAAASPTASPPPPRLARLSFALLAPVGLLALLATLALIRDRRAARAEATARAQELAVGTADRWIRLLEPAPETPTLPGLVHFTIGPSNQLLSPRAGVWPPVPEEAEPTSLPGNRRPLWDAARSAMGAGDWESALEHWDALRQSMGRPDWTLDPDPLRTRWGARILLERAISLERLGRTDEALHALDEILGHPDSASATTEAGIPVLQWALLRRLDLDPGFASSLVGSPAIPAPPWAHALANSPHTPFLDECLARLRSKGPPGPGAPGSSPAAVEGGILGELERAAHGRRLHADALRLHGRAAPWPDAFWIGEPPDDQLVIRTPRPAAGNPTLPNPPDPGPSATFAVLPSARLLGELEAARREFDRRGDFTVRATVAGRTQAAGLPTGPVGELATASRRDAAGRLVVIEVGLSDPGAYFGAQRRRALLFGGLVAGALLAAGLSVQATRRALLRQHELNLQKTNFVSSVSHELRAPLASIRLLAEGLERGTVTGDARRKEYFQLIAQETRRLGSLVGNVLDYSRIEQGRQQYEFEPTDLRALVEGSLKVLEPLATARGVTLTPLLPPTDAPTEAVADGRALQQALLNLLDNALKHSPAGSRIEVHLQPAPPPDAFHLDVRDAGPGIPPDDHARIFEPFYRRGSELRRETPGIGIGLAIVRHILESHGGRVEVRSAPGSGSTFRLVLPRLPNSPPEPVPRPGPAPDSGSPPAPCRP